MLSTKTMTANAAPGTSSPAAPASTTCLSSGLASMERVRYFARQLITPDDLTQEQEYLRARMRRHNRLLHGWGVACGCEVKATQNDWTVTVEPGYVLGPQGDEILIDQEISVDLSQQGLDGNAVPCGEAADPWCASVRVDRKAGDTLYLAVAYAECYARPVRVQAAGCGCDGSDCEYSRVRDGFVLRALTQLPASYTNMQAPGDNPIACPQDGIRQCPDCPSDPWVILATINLKGKKIADADIDNLTLRRYVAAFGGWWFSCAQQKQAPPTGTVVNPINVQPAQPVAEPTPAPAAPVVKKASRRRRGGGPGGGGGA